jgi:O-6-methylguanine DNA methyltransferase
MNIKNKKLFSEKVMAIVYKIPSGKTLSYKEVAKLAGSPCAYRAVGNILNKNYNPKIPCHRVIRSDGKIGGYNRGTENKIRKLRKEKVKIINTSITKICRNCRKLRQSKEALNKKLLVKK